MDNMIPLTQTTVKSRKATGSRDNEIVQGWERYDKIACKLALRWHAKWFPTREDLIQAAALAASVAINELGEETTLKELVRVLGREIVKQTVAYGQRWAKVKLPNGTKHSRRINREITYSQMANRQDEYDSTHEEYLESRMMIVGVGEYTRKHAHFLHDLLH